MQESFCYYHRAHLEKDILEHIQRDYIDAAPGLAGHQQALCGSEARQPHGATRHPLPDQTGDHTARVV